MIVGRLLRRWFAFTAPEDGLAETLAITVRCARRCAYDLAHAADFIPAGEWERLYQARARHWQQLFSSGASMKDYRLRLHDDIEARDITIEKLRNELRKLGHSGNHAGETPF